MLPTSHKSKILDERYHLSPPSRSDHIC
uniref:Uncharacterized protein n=1 Tax=Anguilla anguilla TaxID=7936 RepID=A0A0E9PWX0_ANGAN